GSSTASPPNNASTAEGVNPSMGAPKPTSLSRAISSPWPTRDSGSAAATTCARTKTRRRGSHMTARGASTGTATPTGLIPPGSLHGPPPGALPWRAQAGPRHAGTDGVPGDPEPSGGVRDVPARHLEDPRELALARLRRMRDRHIAAGVVRQRDVRPREQRFIAE